MTERLARFGVTLGASLTGGGQGDIHRATGADGSHLVVKVRKPKNVSLERFSREIRTMTDLNERGCTVIPNVAGSLIDGEFAAYWMPYYEAGTLQKRLDEDSVGDVLPTVRQLVQAIAVLHSFGPSHRDIKPDNILFDGERVLLGDLGLALDPESDDARLTTEFEQVGPRFYMAPEMADGFNDSQDHRPADLYSMSKVIWCVLRRKERPHDREASHWEEANRPSTAMREPAWLPIEERLQNWMSPDPQRRTATFDQMLGAIDDAERVIEERKVRRPSGVMAPDPLVARALELRRAQHLVDKQQARAAEEASDRFVLQQRIETATAWYDRALRPAVTQFATQSAAFGTYVYYADKLGPDVLQTRAMMGRETLPQEAELRLPATSKDRPDVLHSVGPPNDWYRRDYLYDMTIGIDGVERRFALLAVLGTEEMRLEVCQLRNMAGPWMRVDSEFASVEFLTVNYGPSVARAGELAVIVVTAAVRFIEQLMTEPDAFADS